MADTDDLFESLQASAAPPRKKKGRPPRQASTPGPASPTSPTSPTTTSGGGSPLQPPVVVAAGNGAGTGTGTGAATGTVAGMMHAAQNMSQIADLQRRVLHIQQAGGVAHGNSLLRSSAELATTLRNLEQQRMLLATAHRSNPANDAAKTQLDMVTQYIVHFKAFLPAMKEVEASNPANGARGASASSSAWLP